MNIYQETKAQRRKRFTLLCIVYELAAGDDSKAVSWETVAKKWVESGGAREDLGKLARFHEAEGLVEQVKPYKGLAKPGTAEAEMSIAIGLTHAGIVKVETAFSPKPHPAQLLRSRTSLGQVREFLGFPDGASPVEPNGPANQDTPWATTPKPADPAQDTEPPYRSITVQGKAYTLTVRQGDAVRYLNGLYPGAASQDAIRTKLRTTNPIRKVFRGNIAAFDVLIEKVPGKARGMYRTRGKITEVSPAI